jgi:hypothetical protein
MNARSPQVDPIIAAKLAHVSYIWAHEYAKRAKQCKRMLQWRELAAEVEQMCRARRNAQAWGRVARAGGAK